MPIVRCSILLETDVAETIKPGAGIAPVKMSKPASKPKPVAAKPVDAKPAVPFAAKPAIVPPAAPKLPITKPAPALVIANPVVPKSVVAKPVVAKPVPPVTRAPAAVLATTVAPQTPPVRVVPPVAAKPINTAIQPAKPEEAKMNETMTNMSNGAADAIKSGAANVYTNGKAALEQVTAKSKEAVETGMKSMDELSAMTKGNVEALMASTKAATAGLETIAHQVAEFSRKSFEDTTAVARAMTTVKTPNEFMQLQSDFAKAQFDAAVAEMSKLSETMVKLAGEVFEPMQNRVALATDKMKSAVGTGFKL